MPLLDKVLKSLLPASEKRVAKSVTRSASEQLEEVFKRGIENYSKEDLNRIMNLPHHGLSEVYRYDRYATDLMKKGFQKELAQNPPLGSYDLEARILNVTGIKPEELQTMVRTGKFSPEVSEVIDDFTKYKGVSSFDEPGLYWTVGRPGPIELRTQQSGKVPPYQPVGKQYLIEGLLNPRATSKSVVEHSGELIQKEPGQVLAKYKDLFKIIGLGGATTLGSQLIPTDEAQAEPISGRIGKTMIKELGETFGQSSAAERLIGKVVDGKTVKDVLKGANKWRYIIFEDGSRLPVRNDALLSIMRETRTDEYIQKFKSSENEASKLAQARKSLSHHMERQQPLVDKEAKIEWYNNQVKYSNETGIKVQDWVYVESHNVYLPIEYAKVLEDAGVIQIKKGK